MANGVIWTVELAYSLRADNARVSNRITEMNLNEKIATHCVGWSEDSLCSKALLTYLRTYLLTCLLSQYPLNDTNVRDKYHAFVGEIN